MIHFIPCEYNQSVTAFITLSTLALGLAKLKYQFLHRKSFRRDSSDWFVQLFHFD